MNENIEKRDRFFNILTFVLGITSAFSVRLIGVIYIAELICVVCFLFISKRKDCFPVQLRRMYIFLWIWIAGSVISNWYNQVPALDFLKGLFFKLFILVILPVLYWLLESHPERIFFWLFGTAFSSLLSLYVFPSVIAPCCIIMDDKSAAACCCCPGVSAHYFLCHVIFFLFTLLRFS